MTCRCLHRRKNTKFVRGAGSSFKIKGKSAGKFVSVCEELQFAIVADFDLKIFVINWHKCAGEECFYYINILVPPPLQGGVRGGRRVLHDFRKMI